MSDKVSSEKFLTLYVTPEEHESLFNILGGSDPSPCSECLTEAIDILMLADVRAKAIEGGEAEPKSYSIANVRGRVRP